MWEWEGGMKLPSFSHISSLTGSIPQERGWRRRRRGRGGIIWGINPGGLGNGRAFFVAPRVWTCVVLYRATFFPEGNRGRSEEEKCVKKYLLKFTVASIISPSLSFLSLCVYKCFTRWREIRVVIEVASRLPYCEPLDRNVNIIFLKTVPAHAWKRKNLDV